MNRISNIGLVVIALATVSGTEQVSAQNKNDKSPATAAPTTKQQTGVSAVATTPEEVRRAAQQIFGFVPKFILSAPETLLVGFWSSLSGLQMNPNTALDGKTKELIGLAVAAQVPCEYCVYFHTAAARKNGASEQEIKEAVGMAALTRMASTMLNGSQMDPIAFRKEADRIINGGERRPTEARTSPAPRR